MKDFRITSIFPIFVALICAMAGCTKSEPPRYKIGVAQCSDDDWRRQMNEEMRREMLFHDDATLDIRSADDSNERQIADIQYFIDNDYDIIITAPNEAEAITPVIKKAYEAGIPVIIFDRNIIGDSYTSYMELDNEGIGASAGRYAIHLMGGKQAKVVEICGLPGSTPAQERHEGFTAAIATAPNVELAASETALWNGDRAFTVVDSILAAHPDIDLIYAHNDVMAIGAAKAAKARGLDNIKILGTDAAPGLGIKAVEEGVIDATFIYPTEGNRVIRTAMAILKGEPYKKHDHVPALSSVDSTNAEILLRQNELLKDETAKIQLLKSKNDDINTRHHSQTMMLYIACVAAVLLVVVVAVLLKLFSQRSRFQKRLTEKNRQLEEERDKQEALYRQLDELTAQKLVFFTNVSHDLRTPLTLITEPVEQLAEADYLTPSHKAMMTLARKNTKILRRLIDQILDFRKYENGKTELNLSETAILPLIAEWVEAFVGIARKRHISLSLNIDSSDTSTIALDVEKVERVFFNLMSNAFKHTPDNGTIELTATLGCDKLRFSVCDNGEGIASEDLRKIFDRFFQVDKVHPKGSGIGLSLSKAFIEMHGGEIKATSVPGEGSCFSVEIPVRHVEGAHAPQSTPILSARELEKELVPLDETKRVADSAKPLLLVIDDNWDVLRLISEILNDDYNVITADNGLQGIRLARKYVPDIIICDIMMPGKDGLETTRIIKNELSTSHIPILILTACKMDEQRLQSYESGADGFLSKPFSADILRSRCRNLLENRKRIHDIYSSGNDNHFKAEGGKQLYDGTDLNDPKGMESDFYRSFMKVVMERYTDSELNVDDVAAALGLGSAQLSRKIKALTNYSPVEIIRNTRLKEARRLLVSTEKTVSEIAYEVGFSSPPYFSKCFRDFFHCAPSDVRR